MSLMWGFWKMNSPTTTDYYSSEKLFRDVPEFQPQISLEQGMTQVFEVMEREGRIPDADALKWEDEIIERYRKLWE